MDIEKLVSKAEEERNNQPKKKINPVVLYSTIGLFSVVGVLAFVFLAPRLERVQLTPNIGEDAVSGGYGVQAQNEEFGLSAELHLIDFPVEVPMWAKMPYQWLMAEDDFKERVVDWSRESGLFDSITHLPSLSDGYTNDIDTLLTGEGYINPMFSSIILEDVMFSVTVNTMKMINPVFGGFNRLQAEEGEMRGFFLADVTSSLLPSEELPVISRYTFPELNRANFDNQVGFSFVGEIQSIEFGTSEFVDAVDFIGGLDVTVNVTFVATNGEQVEGSLTFNYEPFIDEYGGGSEFNNFNSRLSDITLNLDSN